ncbi:ComEA family DNA-binding protein [Photobacterium damselae]|uniref:ComEA family DNA-binding protein n=1 Tax=Photobacterium damselae TaxID=38293 RepID=UPI00165DF406|nr:helix-hairpin-helix domain-containing protein [Photobacterium damselae]
MFRALLLSLMLVAPFVSQAATPSSSDVKAVIKQCETKYKADAKKKSDCIAKAKKSESKVATKSTKDMKKDVKKASHKATTSATKDVKKTKAAVKKNLKVVNVNKASASDLAASLPGIGDAKAKAIVDYRKKHGKFKSAKDLEKVPGLGAKSVGAMSKYLKF